MATRRSGLKRGQAGGSMGGWAPNRPARSKASARARAAEDRSWAQRSGPVTVRYACICPAEGCKAHEDVA